MLTILSTKSSQVPVITKVGAVFVWCADNQPETTGMSDDNFLNEYEPGPVDQRRAKRGGRKKRTKKPMAGYIFCCNNVTEEECLQRGLFGGPSERNEHEEIVPCMPLFLYNTDDRELSGPFMAESKVKSLARTIPLPSQVVEKQRLEERSKICAHTGTTDARTWDERFFFSTRQGDESTIPEIA